MPFGTREQKLAYLRDYMRRRYAARDKGVCWACKVRPCAGTKVHCEACLEDTNRRSRENTHRLREAALAAYGGPVCACCGETKAVFLCLDHVNGGGNEHRRLLGKGRPRSGRPYYKWLRDRGYPPGFQVLCFNCNIGRHLNGGVCPYKSGGTGDAIGQDYA